MADKIKPLTASLAEFRRILERREKLAIEVAERAPLPRFKKASLEEAAFFSGLNLLVNELEITRAHILGDVSQSFSGPRVASLYPEGPLPPAMTPESVKDLLGEIHGLLATSSAA